MGGTGGRPAIVLVVGVAGSGKSTVGSALAARLGLPFLEGDDIHPAANIAKMRAGHALDDTDRAVWLDAIADRLRHAADAGEGLVVACSALRRGYRDVLRAAAPALRCLCLDLDRATARARVAGRTGHFMPAGLVDSQFAALQPLGSDEAGVTLDATAALPDLLAQAQAAVGSMSEGA